MRNPNKAGQRQDNKEHQNVTESFINHEVLRSCLSKKQAKKKANYFRSQISFSRLLQYEGRALAAADQGYICVCPFCFGLEPRFYIQGNDTRATCFSCDWSGDIIDYILETQEVCFECVLEILSELPPTVHKNSDQRANRVALMTLGLGTSSTTENLTEEQVESLKRQHNGKDVVMFVPGPFEDQSITAKVAAVVREVAKSLTIKNVSAAEDGQSRS